MCDLCLLFCIPHLVASSLFLLGTPRTFRCFSMTSMSQGKSLYSSPTPSICPLLWRGASFHNSCTQVHRCISSFFCRASVSSPHWLLWRLEFCSLSVGALFLSLPWLWSSRVFTSVACVLRWDLQSVLPLPLLVLASHWFWSVSLITCSACFPEHTPLR